MLVKYLIVCPLVLIAGFIDAIAGGGGLISLPAYMIAGLPPHTAIATNKLSSSMGTSVAVVRYAREGYIPWRPAVLCALFAVAAQEVAQAGQALSSIPGAAENDLCAGLIARLDALGDMLGTLTASTGAKGASLSGMVRCAQIQNFVGQWEMMKELVGS